MGATVGREADALALFARLAEGAHRHDFYETLRRLEALHPDRPRWGRALRPVDEPVRLGQSADLSFAPTPLASFEYGEGGRRPRLLVHLFGLLGPNGPLPLHITEYARGRLLHHADPTLSRFLDVFHHRFLALFYRAWAQAQPHVSHDRPDDDRFAAYVGALVGIEPAALRDGDSVPDLARLYLSGWLSRHVRNRDGLAAILECFFAVPVQVEEFVGHWLPLGERERTALGREGALLGQGAVLGARVWDRQSKFRIRIGPLTLAQYETFLPAPAIGDEHDATPGPTRLVRLVDWVRSYLTYELDWDLRLELQAPEVPRLTLGGGGRLGWTTWLGQRPAGRGAADDLRLDAEAFVAGERAA